MKNRNIYIFLLLFVGMTIQAISGKCPDYDSLPSTCKCGDEFLVDEVDFVLSCSGSTIEELKDALCLMDKSSRLEVHLEEMKLGELPSKIFYGLNVVKLDISHCELDGLAPPGETVLEGLEENLEVLNIVSSFTEEKRPTSLPPLAHLRSLKELELSHNAITELSDDWFSQPPPLLSYLLLSNNGIEKIGDMAFQKLLNLEYLRLDGNRFGPIKRSMLPKPAYLLENLKLDNNALTSLPDDLFSEMPALKVLSIRTNEIGHLLEQTFKLIWSQLDVFDVRCNPLECDSSMEWLFHVRREAGMVLGTCQGPLEKKGMDLEDFIENRLQ